MPSLKHYIKKNKISETYSLAHDNWHSAQIKKNVFHSFVEGESPSVKEVHQNINFSKACEDVNHLKLNGKMLIKNNQYYLERGKNQPPMLLRHDKLNINPWAKKFEDLPEEIEYVRVNNDGNLVRGKHHKIEDNKTVPHATLRWITNNYKELTKKQLIPKLEEVKEQMIKTISLLQIENNKVYTGKKGDFEKVFKNMPKDVLAIGNMVKQEYDNKEKGKGFDLSKRSEITSGQFRPSLGEYAIFDIEPVPEILDHIIAHLKK